MEIRDATRTDIPAITTIFNEAVRNTTAIWLDSEVDEAERLAWFEARTQVGYPVILAIDDDGAAAGYASYGQWKSNEGYRHTVEHSIYVAPGRRGRGIGAALLEALIARARASGMHAMVGAIEAENVASIRLHEKFGFRKVGHMREVGIKFGRWLDLALMQRLLDEAPDEAASPSAAAR